MEKEKNFYTNLLSVALGNMPETCSMVVGPIFAGDKEQNLKVFVEAINSLRDEGNIIFSQLDYLDDVVPEAPHEYEIKFPIFYKGLLYSGKVSKIFVLPGWEKSSGTQKEIGYAKECNITIEYL